MKIQNILSEAMHGSDDDDYNGYDQGDELRPGWSKSVSEGNDYEATVKNYKISYKLYQQIYSSPTRGGFHSPPEQEDYLGDVIKVYVKQLIYLPENFDVDVDLTLGYPLHKNDLQEFKSTIEDMGEQLDANERDEYNRLIGYPFHNNPELVVDIFKAIEKEAENVDKGEI